MSAPHVSRAYLLPPGYSGSGSALGDCETGDVQTALHTYDTTMYRRLLSVIRGSTARYTPSSSAHVPLNHDDYAELVTYVHERQCLRLDVPSPFRIGLHGRSLVVRVGHLEKVVAGAAGAHPWANMRHAPRDSISSDIIDNNGGNARHYRPLYLDWGLLQVHQPQLWHLLHCTVPWARNYGKSDDCNSSSSSSSVVKNDENVQDNADSRTRHEVQVAARRGGEGQVAARRGGKGQVTARRGAL